MRAGGIALRLPAHSTRAGCSICGRRPADGIARAEEAAPGQRWQSAQKKELRPACTIRTIDPEQRGHLDPSRW